MIIPSTRPSVTDTGSVTIRQAAYFDVIQSY